MPEEKKKSIGELGDAVEKISDYYVSRTLKEELPVMCRDDHRVYMISNLPFRLMFVEYNISDCAVHQRPHKVLIHVGPWGISENENMLNRNSAIEYLPSKDGNVAYSEIIRMTGNKDLFSPICKGYVKADGFVVNK